MISGTTAWSRFSVSVDLALVASIVFTYASRGGDILLQRRYPDDTEYRNDMIWLPLSQEDTVKLRSRGDIALVELQFNYKSGAVAKSGIKKVCVGETLATEYVDGSAPDDTQRDGGVIDVTLDDVIVVNVVHEADADAVLYTPQTLTDEQQAQARSNIGAASADTVSRLSKEKADKEFVVSIFEQLKALIEAGKTDEAIAILDEAILDLSVLA